MRVLVFGAKGQLGSEIVKCLRGEEPGARGISFDVIEAVRGDLDLSEEDLISEFIEKSSADWIVNAAAFTNVDAAEADEATARGVNEIAAGAIAIACSALSIPLVHISTDYVFDGGPGAPFNEQDEAHPLSVYGRTKLDGEKRVIEAAGKHLILRCSWIFGAVGNNFVKKMISLASDRNDLGVVADQKGAPTSAASIASCIKEMILQMQNAGTQDNRWGVYHFSGYPWCSWADFAEAIFTLKAQIDAAPPPRVTRIPSSEFPTPARRPMDSRLDCRRMEKVFGIAMDDWKESLVRVLSSMHGVRPYE